MRRGDIVRTIAVVVAFLMALTGSWGLLVLAGVCYQLARVAATAMERRSQRRAEALSSA